MDGNPLILHSPIGFAVAFGAGIISFLSPCVLPLVPSYLSMMSGVGTAELQVASGPNQRRLVLSALAFVGGFTVVFAAFEATASGLGSTLRNHQQALDRIAGAVIVVMGLAFAGLVRPRVLTTERRWHVLPSRLGPWAAPVMGMAFAFGWTPCIGPALAAVLSLAADSHTLVRGEAMLVAYSLGLGVPFVAAGFAFGRLSGVFGLARRHARAINVVSGLVLAALGVLLLTNDLHVLSTWFGNVLNDLGLGRLSTV
ncbi:MAG: cytochrome c biogenesis CcdA family protein [Actinomycetota bacterium]|nr:cytochrome c biogenesis CcdA family protein [Actinomycetota bacterium]